jgi:hypothetical protein
MVRNCWAYDGRALDIPGPKVVLLSTCFRGGVGESEVLLEQVQLNFSCRNKFILVLPCGHQVDNNIFCKVCIFKSLTGYTDDGGSETKRICSNP